MEESPAEKNASAHPATGGEDQQAQNWTRAMRRLKVECGESVFNSWFGCLELDKLFGTVVICSVPTKFLKSWIEAHFLRQLVSCLKAEFPSVTKIVLNVRSLVRTNKATETGNAQLAAISQQDIPGDKAEARNGTAIDQSKVVPFENAIFGRASTTSSGDSSLLGGSPLDRKLTFDTFLVGPSNQLAHAAAQRAASGANEIGLPYNPLYVHAGVGLGKTHLLQAVAQRASSNNRKVIYLTAEKFMYGFVSALKSQSAIAYKEWLRTIDLLIIDDLQFLQGKVLQHEFGHTLNSLIDAGRQIIIAADRPPADQEGMDERIRSRLSGGLCIEMKPFDDDLRLRVVQSRIACAQRANPGVEIPQAVVNYIATVIQTNGRDLEGAVNRLIAHSTLSTTKLTVQSAEAAIQDLIRTREPRRVKVEEILKLVSNHYNVSRQDILSSRRTAVVVKPRQVAMYLAKILTLRSLPEIGRRFGGRDHTTVLHAVRKIESLSAKDPALNEELELLKRMLSDQ